MRLYPKFPSYERAVGFAQGIEFANDSALRTLGVYKIEEPVTSALQFMVMVLDEDSNEPDEERPSGRIMALTQWNADPEPEVPG